MAAIVAPQPPGPDDADTGRVRAGNVMPANQRVFGALLEAQSRTRDGATARASVALVAVLAVLVSAAVMALPARAAAPVPSVSSVSSVCPGVRPISTHVHTPWPGTRLGPRLRQQCRADVVVVQRALRNLLGGRTLAVDGHYGLATAKAVRRAQRLQGLKVDGIVGPQTWEYLQWALGVFGE